LALVVVGILFGIAMIMMQVKSPMLVAVGMYLPFGTTFAIFVAECFVPWETGSRIAAGSTALKRRAWRMQGYWSPPD